MSEHELDHGIDALRQQLSEAMENLERREKDYRIAKENFEYAQADVKGLQTAIAALESLKP